MCIFRSRCRSRCDCRAAAAHLCANLPSTSGVYCTGLFSTYSDCAISWHEQLLHSVSRMPTDYSTAAAAAKTRQKFSLCENLFEKLLPFFPFLFYMPAIKWLHCPVSSVASSNVLSAVFNRSPSLLSSAIILIKEIVFFSFFALGTSD